jgi:hypothetical protein
MKSTILWDITPCSPLKVNRRFLLGIFSTLKMEAMCSSEMSVDFQQATRRHAPEDSTLHVKVG